MHGNQKRALCRRALFNKDHFWSMSFATKFYLMMILRVLISLECTCSHVLNVNTSYVCDSYISFLKKFFFVFLFLENLEELNPDREGLKTGLKSEDSRWNRELSHVCTPRSVTLSVTWPLNNVKTVLTDWKVKLNANDKCQKVQTLIDPKSGSTLLHICDFIYQNPAYWGTK